MVPLNKGIGVFLQQGRTFCDGNVSQSQSVAQTIFAVGTQSDSVKRKRSVTYMLGIDTKDNRIYNASLAVVLDLSCSSHFPPRS